MIIMLFHDAHVSININNQVTKVFKLHRGVRQGYPLAPYLFIITAKALNATIKHARRFDNLKGITIHQCNSQQIISQYANDMSFTMKVEETTVVDNLVGILHKFGIASGLEINWHKCVAYWCSQGQPPSWAEKYPWKWAANGDLSKLISKPFGTTGINRCRLVIGKL